MKIYRVTFNLFTRGEGVRLKCKAKVTVEVAADSAKEAAQYADDDVSTFLSPGVVAMGESYMDPNPVKVAVVQSQRKSKS